MAGFLIPENELRAQAKADRITHISTGVAVVDGGKILVVRRSRDDFLGGNFELPGGGIEDGETFAQAVAREVREETGLTVDEVLGMFPGFDYSTPNKPKVRQYNFLVRVRAGDVRLSSEHDEYRWIGSEDEIDELQTTDAMRTCLKDAVEVAADL